jgi:hypothetical protein
VKSGQTGAVTTLQCNAKILAQVVIKCDRDGDFICVELSAVLTNIGVPVPIPILFHAEFYIIGTNDRLEMWVEFAVIMHPTSLNMYPQGWRLPHGPH